MLGEVYKSRVVEVRYYGLMVELLPSGSKLLLHSSHIDHQPVDLLNTDYKVGDEIMVKYIGKDRTTGKALISRKALLDPTEEPGEEPSAVSKYISAPVVCLTEGATFGNIVGIYKDISFLYTFIYFFYFFVFFF